MKITRPVYKGRQFKYEGKLYTGMNAMSEDYSRQEYSYETAAAAAQKEADEYIKDTEYDIAIIHANHHSFFTYQFGIILAKEVK